MFTVSTQLKFLQKHFCAALARIADWENLRGALENHEKCKRLAQWIFTCLYTYSIISINFVIGIFFLAFILCAYSWLQTYSMVATYFTVASCKLCTVYIYTVTSKIDFDMSDTAYMYQNFTGSCTVTANPRMNLYIYILSATLDCTYQQEDTSQIGQYTTRATIRVINMTADCRRIYCSTNGWQTYSKHIK